MLSCERRPRLHPWIDGMCVRTGRDASDRHYDLELSRITRTIADEGGLNSVCWSGVRKRGEDGRLRLSVKFDRLKYSIEVGYPAPLEAAFSGEPMIKSESIEAVQGKRTVLLMERKNSLVSVRSESGAWSSHGMRCCRRSRRLRAFSMES